MLLDTKLFHLHLLKEWLSLLVDDILLLLEWKSLSFGHWSVWWLILFAQSKDWTICISLCAKGAWLILIYCLIVHLGLIHIVVMIVWCVYIVKLIYILLWHIVSWVYLDERHLVLLIEFKFLTVIRLSTYSQLRIIAWWLLLELWILLIWMVPLMIRIRTYLLNIIFKSLMLSSHLLNTQWIL